MKEELLTPTILALYDPSSESKVSADASSVGMEAVLLQRSKKGEWRPVVFASRLYSLKPKLTTPKLRGGSGLNLGL